MSNRDNELVLTVSASRVRDLFGDARWLDADHAYLENSALLFDLGPTEFVRRGDCEENPKRKQVIPYLLLRCEGEYYRYTRGVKGGESRLHAKHSIGIGGHINPCDAEPILAETIRLAMGREFEEEINLGMRNRVESVTFAGMISDDSDDVGRVHLAVVLILDLESPGLKLRDKALCEGGWYSAGELLKDVDKLENWSRIAIQSLEGVTK